MSKVLKRMKGAFLKNAEEVEVVAVNIKKEEKEVEETKKGKTEVEIKKANKPSEEELSFAQLEAEVENRRRDKIHKAEKEAEEELKKLEEAKEREELEDKLRKEVEEEIYREEFKKSYKEKLLKKMAEEKAEKTKTNTVEEKIVVTEITPAEEAVSDNNTQVEEDKTEEVKTEKKSTPVAPPIERAAKNETKERDFFILVDNQVMKKSTLDSILKELEDVDTDVSYDVLNKFKIIFDNKRFFIVEDRLDTSARAGRFFCCATKKFLSKKRLEKLRRVNHKKAESYIKVEAIYAIVSENNFEREVEIRD